MLSPPGSTSVPPSGLSAYRQLFSRYSDARVLLLAVSGGPDSMALVHLARDWATGLPHPIQLVAATIDHGLRQSSAREAGQVSDWCGSLGVPHETLVWEGQKPVTRVQERARTARYELLHGCAVRIGAPFVLTAHHADDQAETVLQRLARGSGVAGLAGMADQTELAQTQGASPSVILARPLLTLRKQELVDICHSVAQPFVEDPSNADARFARARWRNMADMLAAEGLDVPALVRLASRARRADAALKVMLRVMTDQIGLDGHVRSLATAPEEIAVRWVLQEVTGLVGHAPRYDRAEALAARLQAALKAGLAFRGTLGGLVISINAQGAAQFVPEDRQRGPGFESDGDIESFD